MDNNNMMGPARFPDSYYFGIRPVICHAVAEMDDMSVAYPTQGMYDAMLNRVEDEVSNMYPEEPQEQSIAGQPGVQQEQRFFRRRRVFRDLLGVLLLEELFERRRFHRRF